MRWCPGPRAGSSRSAPSTGRAARQRRGRSLARGDLRMTAFVAALHLRELDASVVAGQDGGTVFENVNTPHDYARARDRVELDEKSSEDRITE